MKDFHKACVANMKFWEQNPTTEAIKPLHPALLHANSYACNIGVKGWIFRTALHKDPNNRKRSCSLLIFVGKDYVGGHYFLPQYGLAFASSPRAMVMHFSVQKEVGWHATTDTFFTR